MNRRPLLAFLVLVTLISGGFIAAMALLGDKGIYLAGPYMFTPALAALLTRLVFDPAGFKDAFLGLGDLWTIPRFWGWTLAAVAFTYLAYTALGSVSWDFTGETFLAQLGQQMASSGQEMTDLPEGVTPKMMLVFFFVGGLTFFNIPTILTGFGEEFGWRGLLFPRLYRIRPWLGFVGGGLIWFAWHVPLAFVLPNLSNFTPVEHVLNGALVAGASIASFTFFAYIFARSRSIWVPALAHAVFNNAGRSFSYLVKVEHPLLANLGLALAMAAIVAFWIVTGRFRVFAEFAEEADRRARTSRQRAALPKLLGLCRQANPGCGVRLQGSVARGTERPGSDVDLTVVLPDEGDLRPNALLSEANHGAMVRVRAARTDVDVNWVRESELLRHVRERDAVDWFMFLRGTTIHDPQGAAGRCLDAVRAWFDAHPAALDAWTRQQEAVERRKADPAAPLEFETQPEFCAQLRAALEREEEAP